MVALGRELVGSKRWITDDQYKLAFAVARVTPGTSLIAFCAATGAQIRGISGAVVAAIALTGPSAVLALLLMQGFEGGQQNPWVMAVAGAMVAAVSGMMWSSVWMLVEPHARGGLRNAIRTLLLGGGAF